MPRCSAWNVRVLFVLFHFALYTNSFATLCGTIEGVKKAGCTCPGTYSRAVAHHGAPPGGNRPRRPGDKILFFEADAWICPNAQERLAEMVRLYVSPNQPRVRKVGIGGL